VLRWRWCYSMTSSEAPPSPPCLISWSNPTSCTAALSPWIPQIAGPAATDQPAAVSRHRPSAWAAAPVALPQLPSPHSRTPGSSNVPGYCPAANPTTHLAFCPSRLNYPHIVKMWCCCIAIFAALAGTALSALSAAATGYTQVAWCSWPDLWDRQWVAGCSEFRWWASWSIGEGGCRGSWLRC